MSDFLQSIGRSARKVLDAPDLAALGLDDLPDLVLHSCRCESRILCLEELRSSRRMLLWSVRPWMVCTSSFTELCVIRSDMLRPEDSSLTVGAELTFRIEMRVANVAETVTVSAESPIRLGLPFEPTRSVQPLVTADAARSSADTPSM